MRKDFLALLARPGACRSWPWKVGSMPTRGITLGADGLSGAGDAGPGSRVARGLQRVGVR